MNEEFKNLIKNFEKDLNKDVENFSRNINKTRSNKIDINTVRDLTVSELKQKIYHISNLFITQNQLVIEPFEKKNLNLIAKIVVDSDLGYKVIRMTENSCFFGIMPITQETRKRISSEYKKKLEEAKASIRKTRQKYISSLKSISASSDEERKFKKEIDLIIKKFENELLNFFELKNSEIMNF